MTRAAIVVVVGFAVFIADVCDAEEDEAIRHFAVKKEQRLRLVEHWKLSIGPAANDDIFDYLYLVRPHPEAAFTPLLDEKIDEKLVKDSMEWMGLLLSADATPFGNLATVPPPSPDFLPDPNAPRKSEKPIFLSRSRPAAYYLADEEGGLNLLLYTFENREFRFRIQESSAAILILIQPRTDSWNLEAGIPRNDVEAIVKKVVNVEDLRITGRLPLRPFRMAATLAPGGHFTNADDFIISSFPPVDWSERIVGFVTECELGLVLVKRQFIRGAASPLRSSNISPNWLKMHLYQSNGEVLVSEGDQ